MSGSDGAAVQCRQPGGRARGDTQVSDWAAETGGHTHAGINREGSGRAALGLLPKKQLCSVRLGQGGVRLFGSGSDVGRSAPSGDEARVPLVTPVIEKLRGGRGLPSFVTRWHK